MITLEQTQILKNKIWDKGFDSIVTIGRDIHGAKTVRCFVTSNFGGRVYANVSNLLEAPTEGEAVSKAYDWIMEETK